MAIQWQNLSLEQQAHLFRLFCEFKPAGKYRREQIKKIVASLNEKAANSSDTVTQQDLQSILSKFYNTSVVNARDKEATTASPSGSESPKDESPADAVKDGHKEDDGPDDKALNKKSTKKQTPQSKRGSSRVAKAPAPRQRSTGASSSSKKRRVKKN